VLRKEKTFNCGGYACTILISRQHNSRNTKEHNHNSDDTREYIITAVHKLKRKARELDIVEYCCVIVSCIILNVKLICKIK
jgi:hypothetical protein